MISVEEAQALAIRVALRDGEWRPKSVEVSLGEALGRVLAADVVAEVDAPGFANAAMDGFAVGGEASTAAIIGEAAAGRPFGGRIDAGQAVAITTGAPVPAGAVAVVKVEDTRRAGESVEILKPIRAGQHIRMAGEDLRRGEVVLRAGTTLGAVELAVAATAGWSTLRVARRPHIVVMATGDELVPPGNTLPPGGIYDSNTPMLSALATAAGAAVSTPARVGDDPAAVRAALEAARAADAIVTAGGVSVGTHDHVRPAVEALGGSIDAWRVDMKPGKPVALARLGATPLYGLPGNPASAMLAFWLFVRPALRAMLGCAEPMDLRKVNARLLAPLRSDSDRRSFLRAQISFASGEPVARVAERQGSHVLSSLVGCNAFVVLSAGRHELAAGASVEALVMP
jgi:molybdopterin molybdotransferase